MRGRWENKGRERKGSAYGSGVCNWKWRKWGNEFYKERNKKKNERKEEKKIRRRRERNGERWLALQWAPPVGFFLWCKG